jgi:hypothetical protein
MTKHEALLKTLIGAISTATGKTATTAQSGLAGAFVPVLELTSCKDSIGLSGVVTHTYVEGLVKCFCPFAPGDALAQNDADDVRALGGTTLTPTSPVTRFSLVCDCPLCAVKDDTGGDNGVAAWRVDLPFKAWISY